MKIFLSTSCHTPSSAPFKYRSMRSESRMETPRRPPRRIHLPSQFPSSRRRPNQIPYLTGLRNDRTKSRTVPKDHGAAIGHVSSLVLLILVAISMLRIHPSRADEKARERRAPRYLRSTPAGEQRNLKLPETDIFSRSDIHPRRREWLGLLPL